MKTDSTLKIKQLHPDAILPTYGSEGAACFDLYGIEDAVIPPGAAATIRTGLAFEVPPGYVLMVYSRSGHGYKNCVRLANCTGVVDSDYRGEVSARLMCDAGFGFRVAKGDRIAQALIVPAPQWKLEFASVLSDTARGTNGFGSTGA